ncbi:MAG: hypothetical protein RLP13_06045, partial [Cytophagales bacterium]
YRHSKISGRNSWNLDWHMETPRTTATHSSWSDALFFRHSKIPVGNSWNLYSKLEIPRTSLGMTINFEDV